MLVSITDAVALGDTRTTKAGYLVADARIARTGIQIYGGDEVGMPDLARVRVYRSEDEVFAHEAMASFAHKPVTLDHPSRLVTAKTWKDDAVGHSTGDVARDGDFLRIPLMVADADAVQAIDDGHRELSCGYTCEITRQSGMTPAGEAFDAIQTAIRGNHIAVVKRGRAGAACRIGDAWTETPTHNPRGPTTMADTALRTVTVDGISISVTDQGAQMIERLQTQLRDATALVGTRDAEVAATRAANASAIQAKDGQLAALDATHKAALEAKDGEIAGLRAQIPDAAAMDALIVDRERTITAARKMLGDTYDAKGKSNADIRRAAVVKRLGDTQVAGKSDDYIAAAFDAFSIALGDTRVDPVRGAIIANVSHDANPAGDAYAQYVKRLEDGWKPVGAAGRA